MRIKITIKHPTFKQRIVLWSYNFLLWMAHKIFKDEKRFKKEATEIISSGYTTLTGKELKNENN